MNQNSNQKKHFSSRHHWLSVFMELRANGSTWFTKMLARKKRARPISFVPWKGETITSAKQFATRNVKKQNEVETAFQWVGENKTFRTNKEDQSEYQARHIQKLSIWNFDTGMAYRQRRLSNQLRIPVQVNDAAAGNRPDRRHGLEISQVYQRKTRSNCIQSTDHLQLSEILRHAKDIPTDLDLLISWVRTDERDNKWWQAPQNIGSPRKPAVTLDTTGDNNLPREPCNTTQTGVWRREIDYTGGT